MKLDLAGIDYKSLTRDESLLLYKKIIRYRLVNRVSKKRVHCDEHHIIPKWICYDRLWKNHRSNRINLLIHEHFICHYLLYRYYNNGYAINAFALFLSTIKELGNIDIDNLDIYTAAMKYEEIVKLRRGDIKVPMFDCIGCENGVKGARWWNNGIRQILAKECPGEGFILGVLCKGKTNIELYGEERAMEIRNKILAGMKKSS